MVSLKPRKLVAGWDGLPLQLESFEEKLNFVFIRRRVPGAGMTICLLSDSMAQLSGRAAYIHWTEETSHLTMNARPIQK